MELPTGDKLEVDTPCTLLWNEKTRKVSVANPHCESQNPATITVTLTGKKKVQTLTFDMPQGEMAGSTVAQIAKK